MSENPLESADPRVKERLLLEGQSKKRRPLAPEAVTHWELFVDLVKIFHFLLKLTPFEARGRANAKDLVVHQRRVFSPNLPAAFDGYTIMQLTDLHLDESGHILPPLYQALENHPVDLLVLTGDYGSYSLESKKQNLKILDELVTLVGKVKSKDGARLILGNHDSGLMVPELEKRGLKFLINESERIVRNNQEILLFGTDDVHYFYSPEAINCLKGADSAFSVALIHSPELYDFAANSGIDLYLTGHTHGGQIALPGGRPLLTHLNRGRRYASGAWKFGHMQGYTSPGIGTSGIPIRFFTRPEVTIHELKCVSNTGES